ncbi:MAG: hypothetical protein LIP23_09960, partial [Planctomycetes bacterium]|nr:hypothetical protein [Planctomycetota bacterium]
MAEQYLMELEMAVEADNHADAVAIIEKLRELRDQVELPVELEYHYAVSLFNSGQTEKALEKVIDYLASPDIDSEYVRPALKLKIDIEKHIKDEEVRIARQLQENKEWKEKQDYLKWYAGVKNVLRGHASVEFWYTQEGNQFSHELRYMKQYSFITKINGKGLGGVNCLEAKRRLEILANDEKIWADKLDYYRLNYYMGILLANTDSMYEILVPKSELEYMRQNYFQRGSDMSKLELIDCNFCDFYLLSYNGKNVDDMPFAIW